MLPNVKLNVVDIDVGYGHDNGWLQAFRTARFGELSSITFFGIDSPKGFLEAFERVTHTTSIATTLSRFLFFTPHGWEPNYLSLLPFTRLKQLIIEFSCARDCTSTVDDDIITDLARALPELEIVRFGKSPCGKPTGITARGFTALARCCLRLSCLSIHFQVASLSSSNVSSGDETAIPQEECGLTELHVGYMLLPDDSGSMVIEALTRIFPRLKFIDYSDRSWKNAVDAMMDAKGFVDHTRDRDFSISRTDADDALSRIPYLERFSSCKCAEVSRSSRFDRGYSFF